MTSSANSNIWSSVSVTSMRETPASSLVSEIGNFKRQEAYSPVDGTSNMRSSASIQREMSPTANNNTAVQVTTLFTESARWAIEHGYTSSSSLLVNAILICWMISTIPLESGFVFLVILSITAWIMAMYFILSPRTMRDIAGTFVGSRKSLIYSLARKVILICYGVFWGWAVHSWRFNGFSRWGPMLAISLWYILSSSNDSPKKDHERETPTQTAVSSSDFAILQQRIQELEIRQKQSMQKALVDSQKKNLCLAELRSLNLGLADQVSALSDSLIRLANNTKSRPHYYHNLRNTAERTWNAFVAVHHVITLIFNSPAYIMQMVKDRIFLKMLENLLEQKASHQREAAI